MQPSPGYIVVQGPAYGASNNGRMFLFEAEAGTLLFRDVIVASSIDFKLHIPDFSSFEQIQDVDGDGHPDVRLLAKIGPSWNAGSFVLYVSIRNKKLALNRNRNVYRSLYEAEKSRPPADRRPIAEFTYGVLSGQMRPSEAVPALGVYDRNAANMLRRINRWDAELHEHTKFAIQREVILRGG
jgi:hypothetical protein